MLELAHKLLRADIMWHFYLFLFGKAWVGLETVVWRLKVLVWIYDLPEIMELWKGGILCLGLILVSTRNNEIVKKSFKFWLRSMDQYSSCNTFSFWTPLNVCLLFLLAAASVSFVFSLPSTNGSFIFLGFHFWSTLVHWILGWFFSFQWRHTLSPSPASAGFWKGGIQRLLMSWC